MPRAGERFLPGKCQLEPNDRSLFHRLEDPGTDTPSWVGYGDIPKRDESMGKILFESYRRHVLLQVSSTALWRTLRRTTYV